MPANEARELRKRLEALHAELRDEKKAHDKAVARIHKLERSLHGAEAHVDEEHSAEAEKLQTRLEAVKRALWAAQRQLAHQRDRQLEQRRKEAPARARHHEPLHVHSISFPLFSRQPKQLALACAFGDRLSPQQLVSINLAKGEAVFWYFGDPAAEALGRWHLHANSAKYLEDAHTLAREVPAGQLAGVARHEGRGLVVWSWHSEPRD